MKHQLIRPVFFLCALVILTGCSARIDSEAIDGQVDNYRHSENVQRSVEISWSCRTTSLISSIFSSSGDTGCNDERGRGEVRAPIDPDGTFEIPALDVRVTKFLSKPSLYIQWRIVTERPDGAQDAKLLTRVKVVNDSFLQSVIDEHRRLRHIAIQDACLPATITAIDGEDEFPFHTIRDVYPDTYNITERYVLSVDLTRGTRFVTTSSFTLDYDHSQFCAVDLGLFLPAEKPGANERLVYSGLVEVDANVVYSYSEPHPKSGQRTPENRRVSKSLSRKAETEVTAVNKLPDRLLEPVNIVMNVSRPDSQE